MLELAKVTAADTVYDLGSGDGKIVIAAAKQFGAKGVGVEYDEGLVEHSRCLAAAEGVADRVTFLQGDLFETDFGDATVVTLYLTPQLNLRLMSKLRALKPGTRIVSYAFTIGDWEPDDHIDSFGDGSAYLWIIPPRVAGTWTFRAAAGRDDFEVRLEQTSQRLRGAEDAAVLGPVRGDEIAFALIRGAQHVRAVGTVTGDRIAATVIRGDTPAPYDGTRH
jgi:SAM-dependent methyltransferase